jgi:hypothetical protein
MQLETFLFQWKSDNDNRVRAGFKAQEVEKVYPYAVYDSGEECKGQEMIEGEGGKRVMSHMDMIALLVKSVQELKAEVDSLKSKKKTTKKKASKE